MGKRKQGGKVGMDEGIKEERKEERRRRKEEMKEKGISGIKKGVEKKLRNGGMKVGRKEKKSMERIK